MIITPDNGDAIDWLVCQRGIAAEIRALFPSFELTDAEYRTFLIEIQRRGFQSTPGMVVIGPPSGMRKIYRFADGSYLLTEIIGGKNRVL